MLATVKQILDSKGHEIWSIAPDDMVFNALKLMEEKNVGALLALEEGKLIGIISERDYARKVIPEGKSSMDTPVEEIMTPRVLYVRTNQSIEECMAIMTDKHIRHLPVLEGSELVGVISIGDVVKAVMSHQEFVIEQLENYIAGR